MPASSTQSKSVGVSTRTRKTVAAQQSYHHGDLRNALIREGRQVLEEGGARDMSLREVARRAGVSEAAPARHFEGKEGLLAAIAQSGFDELAQERVKILASGLEPLEASRQMMLNYIEFAQRQRGLFYLMVGPVIIERSLYPDLLASSDNSFALFSATLSQFARLNGWLEAELPRITHSAWAVEHGLATLIIGNRVPRRESTLSVQEMVDFSLSMLLAAISSGPAHTKKFLPGSKKRKS